MHLQNNLFMFFYREKEMVLQHYLVFLLAQSCPSYVLAIVVSNMVEFVLKELKKVSQVDYVPNNSD